ncbi:hypothetical protein E5288_WYG022268 [Bos mutus]|uniref:Uncharacterized protein n=1 Tax=Bos mutus TaxID=72004 RepID=A0A6B0S3L0_9CETA|nr:hypothetical protein [Bos mutus]
MRALRLASVVVSRLLRCVLSGSEGIPASVEVVMQLPPGSDHGFYDGWWPWQCPQAAVATGGGQGGLQILKTSKSLCPLDYEDEDEEDTRVRMALSSPCDPCGPAMRGPGLRPTSLGLGSWWGWATGEGGSGGDPGDWDSAGEEGVLPRGPGELDLEQMESC